MTEQTLLCIFKGFLTENLTKFTHKMKIMWRNIWWNYC